MVQDLTSTAQEALRVNPKRLAALRETQLLDTQPEEVFDRLTGLAANLLGLPVSFLSLVDSDRDYHKSRHIMGTAQKTDLVMQGQTFCHFTLASPGPLLVDDARLYPAYADISTVREQGVRAFAGIPLTSTDGQRIGTFCVVDVQPRDWSERDLEILSELANAALREISLRVALRRAEENAQSVRRAVRAREEVLAVVAHNLRSPLNIIRFTSQSLSESAVSGADVDSLARLQRATLTLQDVIVDLLEVSKVRHTRTISQESRVSPEELLNDARLMMEPIGERSEVTLKIETETNLQLVDIDYERMLRALSNLIAYAINWSRANGTVTMRARNDEGSVAFSVSASGTLVSIADLAHLFDRLYEGNGDGTSQSGGIRPRNRSRNY